MWMLQHETPRRKLEQWEGRAGGQAGPRGEEPAERRPEGLEWVMCGCLGRPVALDLWNVHLPCGVTFFSRAGLAAWTGVEGRGQGWTMRRPQTEDPRPYQVEAG